MGVSELFKSSRRSKPVSNAINVKPSNEYRHGIGIARQREKSDMKDRRVASWARKEKKIKQTTGKEHLNSTIINDRKSNKTKDFTTRKKVKKISFQGGEGCMKPRTFQKRITKLERIIQENAQDHINSSAEKQGYDPDVHVHTFTLFKPASHFEPKNFVKDVRQKASRHDIHVIDGYESDTSGDCNRCCHCLDPVPRTAGEVCENCMFRQKEYGSWNVENHGVEMWVRDNQDVNDTPPRCIWPQERIYSENDLETLYAHYPNMYNPLTDMANSANSYPFQTRDRSPTAKVYKKVVKNVLRELEQTYGADWDESGVSPELVSWIIQRRLEEEMQCREEM